MPVCCNYTESDVPIVFKKRDASNRRQYRWSCSTDVHCRTRLRSSGVARIRLSQSEQPVGHLADTGFSTLTFFVRYCFQVLFKSRVQV